MGQLFVEKGGRGTAIRPPQLPHLDINVGLGPESEEEVVAGSARSSGARSQDHDGLQYERMWRQSSLRQPQIRVTGTPTNTSVSL